MDERERRLLRSDNALTSHRKCFFCGRVLPRSDMKDPDAERAECIADIGCIRG